MARLMSPSVTIPTIKSFSIAIQIPNRPLLTIVTASQSGVEGDTMGKSLVSIMSEAFVSKRLPSIPPGWNKAKSVSLNPRAFIRQQAMASPMASVAVVDDVGAKFNGQASRFTFTLRWAVEYSANNDLGLPLMPIIGMLR